MISNTSLLSYKRAHERGYSDTRHCQNFRSDTRHCRQKMLDTRHSKFTRHSTPDTQLQKDVPLAEFTLLFWWEIDCVVWKRHSIDTVFFNSTSETVKYLISTLDTDPPFKGPVQVKIGDITTNWRHIRLLRMSQGGWAIFCHNWLVTLLFRNYKVDCP